MMPGSVYDKDLVYITCGKCGQGQHVEVDNTPQLKLAEATEIIKRLESRMAHAHLIRGAIRNERGVQEGTYEALMVMVPDHELQACRRFLGIPVAADTLT